MRLSLVASVLLLLVRRSSCEIIRGTKVLNQPCRINWDCATGLTCIPKTTGSNCTKNKNQCWCVVPSKFTGPCNDKADCQSNLRCINGFCVQPGRNDTSCAPYLDDGDCDRGFTCINTKCAPKSKVNETCNVFWNCRDGEGLTCINKTCQLMSKPGQPCDSSIDCDNSICALGADKKRRCDSDIASIMGSLVAFCVVIITTGTLQFCAWRPRRRQ